MAQISVDRDRDIFCSQTYSLFLPSFLLCFSLPPSLPLLPSLSQSRPNFNLCTPLSRSVHIFVTESPEMDALEHLGRASRSAPEEQIFIFYYFIFFGDFFVFLYTTRG